MIRTVEATCPGCQRTLRIPAEWVDDPLRCRHCQKILPPTPKRPRVHGRWVVAAAGLALFGILLLTAGVQAEGEKARKKKGKKAKAFAAKVEKALQKKPEAEPEKKPEPAEVKKEQEPAKVDYKDAKDAFAVKPMPRVREKADAAALAGRIDQDVTRKLTQEGVAASPPAGDAEFLRRVYLDITGVIPTPEKAAAFLDDKDPAKRAKLIDELLASPAYGRHMGDIWQSLMLKRATENRQVPAEPFVKWLEKNFNDNTPWDRFVTEILTATGDQDKNGAVTYYLFNRTVDKMTDSACKLFLGVQLQCAQCHNHPFTGWKQDDYWGLASFFLKVRSEGVRPNGVLNGTPSLTETNAAARGRNNMLPESAKILPPKFPLGDKPTFAQSAPYRPVLAQWLTAADNPFFARAMVNRVWGQFFGRGFINPVDDMDKLATASHPELLDEVAGQFAANNFDLKYLIRAVCNSQTYQRSSKPYGNNEEDDTLFSHMAVKPLTPEQLFDSLVAVNGPFVGRPQGPRQANQRGQPVGPRAQFVAFFNLDETAEPTEYQAGIPQVLRLMNDNRMSAGAAILDRVRGERPVKAIETLYLATLARRPTPEESARLTAYVFKNGPRPFTDILWALLNSSEFALNH